MKILVLGSIAFDSVETPMGKVENSLGGSASYFACAASYFAPVHLVSVVGQDFPEKYIRFFKHKKINVDGIQHESGQTFKWKGFYGSNLNEARTLDTQLNVLGTFKPNIPQSYKFIPAVFLANFDPDLQLAVLKQLKNPRLIACDTMNLWISIKKKSLLKLLKKLHIFVLNETEAKQLTGTHNLIRAAKDISRLGPKHVIIKKGEHGSLLYSNSTFFTASAYPVEHVYDPTGAGDSFAGGFFGYLASKKSNYHAHLRSAIIYGSIMASFNVESFSLKKLASITQKDIQKRFSHFKSLTNF
ncbi:MAG: PfkB family carbohydrate kinase [bacterium]